MKIVSRLPMSKSLIVLTIALSCWTAWLTILGYREAFLHLIQHQAIAVTMFFGSMIAGATSLGGGAVAFPVFTKLLHINPQDAKVFSLAIQSVGMGAASLAIFAISISIEWGVIFWGSLGGIFGIFLGLEFLAPFFPPDALKMSFTVMSTSFAIALLFLNQRKRQCNQAVPIWRWRERAIFCVSGFLGGIMSGLVGNGIDIFVFSVMVLLFGINEKIATPTSVVLMAINALVGFWLQVFVCHDFSDVVLGYWLAAIPIVVIGAPLGAMFCSLLHRKTITKIIICLIFIEMIASLLIIPLRPMVIYSSLISLLLFSLLNYGMYRAGIVKSLSIEHLIKS